MPFCYLLPRGTKLQRLLGSKNHFTPGRHKAVYACQTGMVLHPHPQAPRHPNLRALAKEHQDTSVHTPCLCLSKHRPQLCTQHHLDQAGVIRSQISKHYEAGAFFAGRCSYNVLKTTSAFQPRLSEGEASACETALSRTPRALQLGEGCLILVPLLHLPGLSLPDKQRAAA